MPVYCSHCNEELFGAVNRCWKCGRHFTARPASGDTPPVRRAPISGPVMLVREERGVVILDDVGRPVLRNVELAAEALIILDEAPVEAEIVDAAAPALVATIAEPPPMEPHPGPAAIPPPGPPKQPSSPFAAGWTDSGPGPGVLIGTTPDQNSDFWSTSAANVSLGLGLVALIAAFFSWLPIALGLAGIGAAVWGLRSPQTHIATAGLGLSCAAIALAEYQAAAAIYTEFVGIHPFAY